ncbi:MAG: DASS family sodium-coupled anion symporter [Aurantimonas endophytica]|jgi:sodium-dependent dicarboxylate transporter 2/3/5|uniref:Sodium-dependent dicarboxylate transporter 2/3/5 n=1 Tax=Aurantimonas endophytica TaxID=1522175 RepID=A0A7W6MRR3_9HYPH|nr:DASS family sodium-coupled anion symporter [Aurantimonas endophytica]MBB4005254.1 sodium-dependent dicarboxylate transporter 2/3/5 [Aurantimonas endophytica]MCO6406084.1 DASS family sodium-coupled anion symporter [Aurantimonas endophytica]
MAAASKRNRNRPTGSGNRTKSSPPEAEDAGSLRLLPALVGIAVFVLLLLLPAPDGLSPEAWAVVAVAALMIVWWITEAVPVPVTALLPLALFPFLGARSMGEAASPYADPVIFLFMGGFILAKAMERWGLHRRVALNIVSRTGSRQHNVVGGFMIATAFCSMWVSNTATTVMMLPIALSVAELLDPEGRTDSKFSIALLLGVAYAASIGGVATLIGTPPNALLAGSLNQAYGYDLGFGRWMLIGLPVAIVMLLISWLLLTRFVVRLSTGEIEGATTLIGSELAGLGKWSRAEVLVGIVFVVTAFLWVFRTSLQSILPNLNDSSIAIAAAVILFLLPSGRKPGEAVLDWGTAAKLPWGILLLFGGGLSLASAVAGTGLDQWIGEALGSTASYLPLIGLVALVTLVILLLTEFTSNTATAATFLPLVAALSLTLGENPLMLAVPAALAASMAFMLPVATPPNAIVFASGKMSIPTMAKIGVWHNLAALIVISSLGYLLLTTLFGVTMGEVPDWARGADPVPAAGG